MPNRSEEFNDIDEFDDFGIDDLDDSALLALDQIENKLVTDGRDITKAVGSHVQHSSTENHVSAARIQKLSSLSKSGSGSVYGAAQLQPSATSAAASLLNRPSPSAAGSHSASLLQRVGSNSSTTSNQPASSGTTRQMTLFGKPANLATPQAGKAVTVSPGHITISSQSAVSNTHGGFPSSTSDDTSSTSSARMPWQNKVGTKTWDRDAYLYRENARNREKDNFDGAIDVDAFDFDDGSSTGDKGKSKAVDRDWDAQSKYENVPAPPLADPRCNVSPPPAQKCKIDLEATKTWIYPTNMEKRDYQYNIVQKALFNNVLVALPTGLGKTFIAAVVILNFFRWFPEGKIIFLAPSRPLVDQQKTACHRICGLPWDCAIDLTGQTESARRGDFWQSKRIFYMTPQTCENDIRNGFCDPHDIVCVVVDEAHKARGKYAYGNVIGLLMKSNPHFRVLGLSATPGKDSDSVQEVVDQLHINQIEIRTEEAIDVQRYMFRKREEIVNVSLGRDLNKVKDNWAKLMQTQMDPLMKAGLLRNQDPVLLHPFAVNAIAKDKSRAGILMGKPWLRANISELAQMALSMQYLMEQSPTMFYNRLKERSIGFNAKGKKTSTNKQQIYANTNTTFAEIMRELEMMQDRKGRILHPKMIKLRNVLSEHFDHHKTDQIHNAEAFETSGHDVLGCTPKSGELNNFNSTSQTDTRVMVFCSYRECCDEIVSFLNDSGFQATEFVGQSKAKNGKKGMSQKDQERVISDFKAGKYNVLVATSIGEEGLDIGSVDLTACYEAVKDSIRMLQRVGRTGRKREGKIVVLVSEGREQNNWQHSKDNYKAVQKDVDSRLYVELFDDVDRMVPDGISPQPILKEVEQPEFDPSMVSDGRVQKRATREKKAPKPKKDPRPNMPEGGNIIEGFRKASTLTQLKRRHGTDNGSDISDSDAVPAHETHSQKIRRLLEASDDEVDSEQEKENLSLDLRTSKDKAKAAKRIPSSPPSSPSLSPAGRGNPTARSSASSSIGTPPVPDSSNLPSVNSLGTTSSSSLPLAAGGSSTRGRKLGVDLRSSGRTASLSLRKSNELSSPSYQVPSSSAARSSQVGTKSPRSRGIATVPITLDDDDEFAFDDLLMDKSMERSLVRIEAEAAAKEQVERESKIPEELLNSPLLKEIREDSARMQHDNGLLELLTPSAKRNSVKTDPIMLQLMQEEQEKQRESARHPAPAASRSTSNGPPSPVKASMGPPDSIPRRAGGVRTKRAIPESPDGASDELQSARADDLDAEADPASSSPIKRPVKRRGRLQKASSMANADGSPTAKKSKTTARARAHIQSSDDEREPSSVVGASKARIGGKAGKKIGADGRGASKKRKITNSPTSRALFQYEAERSTDEEVHGEGDEDDSGLGSSDVDESDREAVGDFMPTQAPRGYHQQGVYMQSILLQCAPTEFQRVRHAPFPGIGGRFGEQTTPKSVRRARIPSSEARGGRGLGSEDRYSEDSFVVNDEDEIVFDSDEDGLPDSSPF